MSQVMRAGEALKGDLVWTEATAPTVLEVFKIANNWRDAHAYPMRRLRYELFGQMRRNGLDGITVARLKRMPSIRRKLQNHRGHLNQIQDLAGCRAILPSINDVNTLISAMRANTAHDLYDEDDYINVPKLDGYRSHHAMFRFRSSRPDEEVYDGRRVEIQIRTRLQHSWATAVEAVGLFRREDLKAGQGSPEWLRLFRLMSAEFALAEGCAEPANASARARPSEIIDLDEQLNAANTLENLSHAVRYTEKYYRDPQSRPEYYLIKYDRTNKVVRVEPYNGIISGVRSYDAAELPDNKSGTSRLNTVLVEADGVENLKAAYPNYFGDVQLFRAQLKNITRGKTAEEYTLPPQETVAPRPREKPDLSWFKKPLRGGR
jgi:hypothetical protein